MATIREQLRAASGFSVQGLEETRRNTLEAGHLAERAIQLCRDGISAVEEERGEIVAAKKKEITELLQGIRTAKVAHEVFLLSQLEAVSWKFAVFIFVERLWPFIVKGGAPVDFSELAASKMGVFFASWIQALAETPEKLAEMADRRLSEKQNFGEEEAAVLERLLIIARGITNYLRELRPSRLVFEPEIPGKTRRYQETLFGKLRSLKSQVGRLEREIRDFWERRSHERRLEELYRAQRIETLPRPN